MRLRLFLSFTLIVLVSVASFALLARQRTASEVQAFMFRGGMTGVDELVTTLEDYYRINQSWQGVEGILSAPGQGFGRGRGSGSPGMGPGMAGMMDQRLRLADAQGALVVDTSDPSPEGVLSAAELDGAIPLAADRRVVGYLLPEGGLVFSQEDESRLLNRLNRTALTAGIIAGSVSLILALLLAYRLLRPIRALTGAAERLAQGELSQRVEVQGDDEIARLGDTFNRMAASLQQAERSRRSMTADIAHELRNPLAVQRANLEALQDGVYPLQPENLEPILEQNHLLTRLVEDLRTLALADADELDLERTRVDIVKLVKRVVDRFQPQMMANQIRAELASPEKCPSISLDPGRVEQILGNLLSNAIRYTPPGGHIDIRLNCSQSGIQLEVHDSGPGIPEEALPNIFERFYRADKARSRSEGGSGLGLAIARQLARAHGGRLTAENNPEGGAVFKLTIPNEEFHGS
ncbi:MAG TPA: ATP-binding protein [Anaerolineales bacterium]